MRIPFLVICSLSCLIQKQTFIRATCMSLVMNSEVTVTEHYVVCVTILGIKFLTTFMNYSDTPF